MFHRSPATLRAVLAAVLVAAISGCATGQRPTLQAPRIIEDDAAIGVIELLDRAPTDPFVAVYEITPTNADAPTVARVTRTDTELRTEIGDTLYVTRVDGTSTCSLDGTNCQDFANDARVSDLNITSRFWGPAFAQRLIVDSERRVGTTESTTVLLAGLQAQCVATKVPSSVGSVGTVTYCAAEPGLLARYVGADVTIELTTFTPGEASAPPGSDQ